MNEDDKENKQLRLERDKRALDNGCEDVLKKTGKFRNGKAVYEGVRHYDPSSPRVQRALDNLERAGLTKKTGKLIHGKPVYEITNPNDPSLNGIQKALDSLERKGVIKKNGKFRNGKPVYVHIDFYDPSTPPDS
jgi:predicted transcriptional regulator